MDFSRGICLSMGFPEMALLHPFERPKFSWGLYWWKRGKVLWWSVLWLRKSWKLEPCKYYFQIRDPNEKCLLNKLTDTFRCISTSIFGLYNAWILYIRVLKAATLEWRRGLMVSILLAGDCIEQFDHLCAVKKLQTFSYYFGIINY